MDAMKECKICHTTRPLDAFPPEKKAPDGRRARCYDCQREAWRATAARQLADPEKRRAANERRARHHRSPRGKALMVARDARRRGARQGGRVTDAELDARLAEYGGMCAYCGVRPHEEWDHFTPASRGGAHEIDNLFPACAKCNRSKSDKLPIFEWMSA